MPCRAVRAVPCGRAEGREGEPGLEPRPGVSVGRVKRGGRDSSGLVGLDHSGRFGAQGLSLPAWHLALGAFRAGEGLVWCVRVRSARWLGVWT